MSTSEFFTQCKNVLNGTESPNSNTVEFLELLRYWPTHRSGSKDLENQLALLALASKFDDVFQLPMPHAPTAYFCGAMLASAKFGVPGHGKNAVSVGGRGINFRQAFESCIGEAAEYLSFLENERDPLVFKWSSVIEIDEHYLDWALSGIGLDRHTKPNEIDWIAATSLHGKGTTFFPSELVLRRPKTSSKGTRKAESAGLGAGATLENAILSGLFEVIERDAIALWWFADQPARRIDDTFLTKSGFMDFAKGIRGTSNRKWWLLDITSDLEVPVIVSISSNPDGTSVIAGACAHNNTTDAMRSAFLEMCQMELAQVLSLNKLENLDVIHLKPQDNAWIERFEKLNVENYPQLLPSGNFKTNISLGKINKKQSSVFRKLNKIGLSAYFVDITRPQINIFVAHCLIPGLQSAKLDWLTPRLMTVADKNNVSLHEMKQRISII